MATVPIDGTVRPAHGAEAEVVRPPQELLVQPGYSVLDLRPVPTSVGPLADLVPKARALLRRRVRPDVGAPRPRRVTQPDRIAQEVEGLLGDATRPRLGLVDRQLEPRHHVPHRGHR